MQTLFILLTSLVVIGEKLPPFDSSRKVNPCQYITFFLDVFNHLESRRVAFNLWTNQARRESLQIQ